MHKPINRQPSHRADWHGACGKNRANPVIERPAGRWAFYAFVCICMHKKPAEEKPLTSAG